MLVHIVTITDLESNKEQVDEVFAEWADADEHARELEVDLGSEYNVNIDSFSVKGFTETTNTEFHD